MLLAKAEGCMYSSDTYEWIPWISRKEWCTSLNKTVQSCSCRRNNAVLECHVCWRLSASYPDEDAASWCIQRTHMVIHQHALLRSGYPLIPQMIKFTSTMQHYLLYTAPCLALYLTETKLPLLRICLLFPLKQSKSLLPFPLPSPCCVCPLPSLSLSFWQHALTLSTLLTSPLPSGCMRSPSALCFLSLTHTLRGSSSQTQRCVPPPLPPTPPPGFISPQNISLHSLSLLLSLSRSHSACRGLSLQLSDCVPPPRDCGTFNMCSGRRLLRCLAEGGSFLRGGEARLGWGFVRGGGVFGGWQECQGGFYSNKGTWRGKRQPAVMYHWLGSLSTEAEAEKVTKKDRRGDHQDQKSKKQTKRKTELFHNTGVRELNTN